MGIPKRSAIALILYTTRRTPIGGDLINTLLISQLPYPLDRICSAEAGLQTYNMTTAILESDTLFPGMNPKRRRPTVAHPLRSELGQCRVDH